MLAIRSFPLIPAARVGTAKLSLRFSIWRLMPKNSQQARHWSNQDTQVDTDTPVARHNRLEEVIFVYAAMMFVLLSSLYQVRRASMPRPIDLIRKWERNTVR
jgi:hypothetical protein